MAEWMTELKRADGQCEQDYQGILQGVLYATSAKEAHLGMCMGKPRGITGATHTLTRRCTHTRTEGMGVVTGMRI